MIDLVVIGGGAAGFFGAINAAEKHPGLQVVLLEKGKQLLGKVKVSGGGRCNVTHACFEPEELIRYYPRGGQELLGPFHRFMTYDTIAWFESRGVTLKTEADNRMFPESNVSQTIIDCFLKEAQKHGVKIYTECGLRQFERENDHWKVQTEHETFLTKKILFACGSSPQIWELFKSKGHHIETPVPSLFTFNISDARIQGLPGLSVPYVTVSIKDSSLEADGPLLITHWGLSGPGILRLSAFGARYLGDCDYRFVLCINFSGLPFKETLAALKLLRDAEGKKLCGSTPQYQLPSRWWKSITDHLGITEIKWASLSNLQLEALSKELSVAEFEVTGKSTFKDEFVTCGGIRLAEVNMKTMQSRILPDVYFAGEMLDIDAITGGFNFQAAWTTSFIASDLQ